MSNMIIYYPYKTQLWALVITLPGGMLAFVGAACCLPHVSGFLCLVGIGMLGIWLSKVLYDASKRSIAVDENGVRIIDSSDSNGQDISWSDLAYAAYARNYKGHLFLILSSDALNDKEAKRLANRGAILSRIYIDGSAVIYLDALQQDVSQLKQWIDRHAMRVDTY